MAASDPHKNHSSSEDSSSTSSSDSSNSTPTTPPSPTIQPHIPPQQPPPNRPLPATPVRTPERTIVRSPNRNGRHSANGHGRSPKSSTPKSLLGVIDENSVAVSPDIPVRSPMRRLYIPSIKFTLPPIPTLYATRRPHKNLYDDIEGPRGEKFSDVRSNNKTSKPNRPERRKFLCFAGLVLIVIAAVLIGLLVGLRKNNHPRDQDVSKNGTNSGVNAGFPAGQYSIMTYLNNVDKSCTSTPATWRCYPDQTYNQSTTASASIINWIVTAQNRGAFAISSADHLFSYTFQNVPLRQMNNGTADEYWMFNTTFDKFVLPSASITSDGSAAACYFNNTKLIGRLYTSKPKAQALQKNADSNSGNSNAFQPWPYALDFQEDISNGVDVPNCYRYVNGSIGERISINPVTASNNLDCQCQYTNHFPV